MKAPRQLKKILNIWYKPVLITKTKLKIAKIVNNEKVYLEIGAGPKKGENGWTTLDIDHNCDLFWDLREGIPFPDNSIDEIYTSHTFEHIPFENLKNLIRECYRCLKPSGKLSVCVPSATYYIESYINGKRFRSMDNAYQPAVYETGSLIDQINYTAYMGGQHKYMFDNENLINILILCGFSSAKPREFGHQLDLAERDFESIYATAIK